MNDHVHSDHPGLSIDGQSISLAQLHSIMRRGGEISLGSQAIQRIQASQQTVQSILQTDHAVYGINTGFGLLAQTRIPADQLSLLQENLILSHAAGTGAWLDDQVVRLMMILKVISLSQGFSGIRLEVVEHLITCINQSFHPCIPAKGSVGASGDLAPLAHMALAMMGEGQVLLNDRVLPAAKALTEIGLSPLKLGPKEGLALINGTQASTALALMALFATEECFAAGLVAGALSVDALMGSLKPFDDRIHQARGQVGQIMVAKALRTLLADSGILASHAHCQRVQDPYSLRCQPQVMGACWDSIRHTTEILRIEANAVTDNPLIFADVDDVISGGNFHAEPVALAADGLALAIAEIGAISERRIAQLVDPKLSGLPAFLVANSGLNSGFMIAQVTAAALASENKSLAHPASVDSLPTSANQEDHVSMATYAARRLLDMAENTAGILAVELLAAAQGIDFRSPLATSPALGEAISVLRGVVPHYDKDRYMAPDMARVKNLVMNGTFLKWTRQFMFPKSS